MKGKSGVLAISFAMFGLAMVISAPGQSGKTHAQQLVDSTMKKNADIAGLEVSATPAGKNCLTIAATEVKEVGEKCDADEFAALKTGKPHIEKEADGYDVTAPLHDASGNLVGTIGIDFKPQPGQTDATILKRSSELVKELERQIPSKEFLFQPAS